MTRWFRDILRQLIVAFQFMTRLPMPRIEFDPEDLPRAAKFFPLVGLAIGLAASLLSHFLIAHLSRSLAAVLVLTFLVLITGAFHEDGLADSADGLGGGWNKDQVLTIMRDSRVGSYGAIAIALSLLARFLLLSSLPADRITAYLVSAHVLCRWTTLPLSYCLAPARDGDGQGVRVAQRVTLSSLIVGTLFTLGIVGWLLHTGAWPPVLLSVLVTCLSGFYYVRRIDGVTGDCFGATNQLTEIAVYFCGVWR